MKLYTKSGDDGSTGLYGGDRVSKDSCRVAAYGNVDETNAAIGAVLAIAGDEPFAEPLRTIQRELFVVGANLASPTGDAGIEEIRESDVKQLESWIDQFHDDLPSMKNFVLPGGCQSAAMLHLARTVCRRAERSVITLARECERGTVHQLAIVYLNRLSDLLFAMARFANHRGGVGDVPWIPSRPDF